MKYQSIITGIGAMALSFLDEKMIILFNENAPAALAEISILHTIEEFLRDIEAGDILVLSGEKYVVTAVGDEANKTFKLMGHCTLKFTGKTEADLPGCIELQGKEIPEIKVGDLLEIQYK
ncbi:PTS system glucitol/sorbitol-specific IIA component [Anaerosolibacter carboniphilus]|uniref:PTS system glucitol/sorbitol-specific IIA component n=1 Tax=Anaerosolibacter carboniphilus TaxID=1417629 RepID=A0A841KZK9_9FIRM|nr:PTS glucitol/sorbitol transporter subunit IIA [Anaerosolibacter carboniphilus]MBB6217410.1 PTS system glucitol/sorbitol-specific IIA component [Anaerosolibacter carboniphilus]